MVRGVLAVALLEHEVLLERRVYSITILARAQVLQANLFRECADGSGEVEPDRPTQDLFSYLPWCVVRMIQVVLDGLLALLLLSLHHFLPILIDDQDLEGQPVAGDVLLLLLQLRHDLEGFRDCLRYEFLSLRWINSQLAKGDSLQADAVGERLDHTRSALTLDAPTFEIVERGERVRALPLLLPRRYFT